MNKRFKTPQINLCDQEARDAFREPPLLTGEDHVQHVSVQLLHDDEDVLRCLEHPLHQDDSQVGETLETKALGRNNPAGAGSDDASSPARWSPRFSAASRVCWEIGSYQ